MNFDMNFDTNFDMNCAASNGSPRLTAECGNSFAHWIGMLLTAYDTPSELVVALGETPLSEETAHVVLVMLRHGIADTDDSVSTTLNNNTSPPAIPLDYTKITPRAWSSVYMHTDVYIVNTTRLAEILRVVNREILRTSLVATDTDADVSNRIFILDGLISCISILFSQCVRHKRLHYRSLNFQLVYTILTKLKELDTLIEGNVQLNESGEVWDLTDKIFLPSLDTCNYHGLVEYLSGERNEEEEADVILGSRPFVSLQHLLLAFGIKRDYRDL